MTNQPLFHLKFQRQMTITRTYMIIKATAPRWRAGHGHARAGQTRSRAVGGSEPRRGGRSAAAHGGRSAATAGGRSAATAGGERDGRRLGRRHSVASRDLALAFLLARDSPIGDWGLPGWATLLPACRIPPWAGHLKFLIGPSKLVRVDRAIRVPPTDTRKSPK
jgi:hypothetical protein